MAAIRRTVGGRAPDFGLPLSNPDYITSLQVDCEESELLISIQIIPNRPRVSPRQVEKYYPWSLLNGQIWDRLCEIVESGTRLSHLSVSIKAGAPTDIPLEMLFDRLKHKQSPRKLGLVQVVLHDIFSHHQYQTMMRDVKYYLEHNPVAILYMYVSMPTTVLHAPVIARLLEGLVIYYFSISFSGARNNLGLFVDMLLSRVKSVKNMVLEHVDAGYQLSAVARLLQNNEVNVYALKIDMHRPLDHNIVTIATESAREISESLVGNTSLKKLDWQLGIENEEIFTHPNDIGEKPSDRIIAHFDKLLCDTSSIDSICRSNHSLTELNVIPVVRNYSISDWQGFQRMCLRLNNSERDDRRGVMRRKIFLFYFAGEFSLVPLQSMPLSVFPTIMDQIQQHRRSRHHDLWMFGLDRKHTYSLSAIFRIIRCFPELCAMYQADPK